MTDRRVTERYIASTVFISQERVHSILTEDLEMRKLSARWVPRLLTVDQKHTRRALSRTNLNLFEEDSANFLKRFVTMDETWVHHLTPETKQQSKKWKHPGSPPPKKANTVPSAEKVMVSVFWDADGILLIDYLQKGQTINGTYYASLLTQLREKLKLSAAESSLKVCCSIRKMLLFTSLSLPWLPFTIVALNWLSINLIHLIWLHQTFIYSKTENSNFRHPLSVR